MSPASRDRELDTFLLEVEGLDSGADCADSAGLGLAPLSDALEPIAPSAGLRARLLENIPATGRFSRFAESVAKLLDLGLDQARALLDTLDDESRYSKELPGISFFWVDGGPRVANAVRGFLRVEAGTDFPEHEHLGVETVLVLQGTFTDPARGQTFLPGDIDSMPANSSHAYTIPKDGPDLLMLSVTQIGAKMLGMTFYPR
jgi:hypothetical protein